MGPGARRLLLAILSLGAALRLGVAFASEGQAYDIGNVRLAGEAFAHDPLSVYRVLGLQGMAGAFELVRWPYPPAYLPVAAVEYKLADVLGLPFHGVVKLAPIAADVAIAWLVQDFLGRQAQPDRVRLGAAALVALGPSFAVISGYHGQIDSVAILPVVAAVWTWEVSPARTRAARAGLLIGLGACVKTVPIVMLVALVPAARSRREATVLVAAVGAVVLLAVTPYLLADSRHLVGALGYSGAPGLGGLTMFLQPGLAGAYLTGTPTVPTPITDWVYHHAAMFVAAGLAMAGLFLLRHRPRAAQAAPLVWLVVYLANPNFFLQYVVWGLPFFLMAGWLVEVAALQVVLLPVAVLTYATPWRHDAVVPYVALMTVVWATWAVLLVRTARAIARSGSGKVALAPQPVATGRGAPSPATSERRRR